MRRLPRDREAKLINPSGSVVIDLKHDSQGRELIYQERKYELITPLFGGGVEPKINDIECLISGKSIRGQLRFWWRASRGTGTLDKLREKEAAIWGATSHPDKPLPSRVSLSVTVTKRGETDTPFTIVRGKPRPDAANSKVPPYAAFSLQPTDEEIKEAVSLNRNVRLASVRMGAEFTLHLTFAEDDREEVEATLWCWETFGGVGGRTRRGFGALALKSAVEDGNNVTPEPWKFREVLKNLNQKLPNVIAKGDWEPSVPHLPRITSGVLKVTNAKYSGERTSILGRANDVLKSWWYAIDKYHRFRQSPRTESSFSGRSDWPEADAIRHKTGRTTFRPPEHKIQKFPRAQFGLPIVFKFKDDDRGEPHKTTAEGANGERLASSLLIRPLRCADGAVSLALILDGPRAPEGGVQLKGYGTVVTDLLLGDEADIPPLRSKSAKTDPLRAFLETL